MNIITEKELLDYLAISSEAAESSRKSAGKKRGIDSFRIEETEDGRFILVMTLTFKKGDFILTSARKTPRLWPNLNTLVAFLKELDFPDAPISLQLLFLKREP
ncbi:MAG: hypothetical protein VB141_10265 [Burkholderia gladioli]